MRAKLSSEDVVIRRIFASETPHCINVRRGQPSVSRSTLVGFFSRRPAEHTFRLGFTNERSIAAVFVVEPWASDYTAAPGQRVELVVRSVSPDLWFNLVSSEDGTIQACLEGAAPSVGVEWEVRIDGEKVEVGHQRAT